MKGKFNMKTKLQLSKNVTTNKSDEKRHGMQVRQVAGDTGMNIRKTVPQKPVHN